jgi:hypothetical protein
VYRYALWRQWDELGKTVVFCGLNPSTADETVDDPTIRRELGYARAWGYGRLVKVNAYGYRSTDPKALLQVGDPEGPENLATILHWAAQAHLFVAAWGNNINARHAFKLRSVFRECGALVHALKLTKEGQPQHPLYLPKTMQPFPWLQPPTRPDAVADPPDSGGVCPNHDDAHVCDECAQGLATDPSGFVHPTLLHGRTPLRRCQVCRLFLPRERWDIHDWFRCRDCSGIAKRARKEEHAC